MNDKHYVNGTKVKIGDICLLGKEKKDWHDRLVVYVSKSGYPRKTMVGVISLLQLYDNPKDGFYARIKDLTKIGERI